MKIRSALKVKKIVFSWFFALLIIPGCVAVDQSRIPVQENVSSVKYQSKLVEPEAKAFFSFSEFRMLGAEDRWDEAIPALERAIGSDPQSEYLQLILSRAYLHREQPEQAVVILGTLLAKNPENTAGHELLGDVFSFQQKYSLAVDHFRRAAELKPESAGLSLRLAMALARLEQKSKAITILESLLEKHPDAELARLTLARLYLNEQQPDKASATYRQLLERQPDQLQVVLEFGKILEKEDSAAALELYQSFIARNPRSAAVRQQLAQYLLKQNRLDAALVQLKAVQQQFPDNLKTINQIGLIQLEQKEWIEAENTFRLLLQAGDVEGDSRYYLSISLAEQEKLAEAIAVLEPLNKDSPIYTESALQLAYLYKRFDQNDRAILILQQLLKEGTERQDLYYYLVVFLDDSGDYKQAIDIALAGVEKYPEDVQLLYLLGALYEKLDKHQAAILIMEKILSLDVAHPDALNFLAYGQAESGIDLELALSRAEKALKLKPSGYIADTLGWVYFKLGRYLESREQLERAIKLHPEDAVIQEHLGDLYWAMKLSQKAESAYRAALKIAPDSLQVEEKLRQLLLESD
ncbi:MAG: tetratricopeptide repeat protein [Desulfuromusa sp.]|nr:tetratricopeptide repeat protein [Desulfuromusa sp.]